MSRFTHAGAMALALMLAAACDAPRATSPAALRTLQTDRRGGEDGDALAFGPRARPYGADLVTWTERWWRWEASIPAAENPSLDQPGSDCTANQEGKVWYLGVVFGNATVTRSCTVPAHRALGLNLSGVLNDYPCPDTSFHPAPGQSLQDFLTQGAEAVVNYVTGVSVLVDGQSVPNAFGGYRVATPLFYFTGDPTLTAALDPCMTGSSQPAVAAGWTMILKPLGPGSHAVVMSATDTFGNHPVLTYDLTVLGEEGTETVER